MPKPDYTAKWIDLSGDPDTYDETSSIPLVEGPSERLRKASVTDAKPAPSWQYQPQVKASPAPPAAPAKGSGMGGSASPHVSPPVAVRQFNPLGALTTQDIIRIAKAMEDGLMKDASGH